VLRLPIKLQIGIAVWMINPPEGLLERLMATKIPHLYAESEVAGDGRDWNLVELGLLGDLSVCGEVGTRPAKDAGAIFTNTWQILPER
jgi:hypothetical protein